MPFVVGDPVEAYWENHNGIGWWWKAIILKVNNRSYRVRFDDYDNSWDMTLRKRFVRRRRQNEVISPDNADGDAKSGAIVVLPRVLEKDGGNAMQACPC